MKRKVTSMRQEMMSISVKQKETKVEFRDEIKIMMEEVSINLSEIRNDIYQKFLEILKGM